MASRSKARRERVNVNLPKRRKVTRPRPDHARCPVSGKMRYKTQQNAENAMKQILLTGGPRQQAWRPYPCDDCGGWHLSSKPRLRPY